MKIIKRLAVLIGAIYVLACIALFFFQDQFLFDPSHLSEDYSFRSGKEVEIEVTNGISLNCLFLQDPSSRGVILYLHGNRGSNRRCLRQAEMMTGGGYDIFMPDYRGFGKSEGRIVSQAQMYRDVQAVYDYLKERYTEDRIAIVGYSLGTGMASYLAAQNRPGRLFLVAPYVSFIDMKNRIFPLIPNFLVKYPLSNRKHLTQVSCPVTLFHGTRDEIIPFDSSIILQDLAPEQINLVRLDDTGHRRSIFHDRFRSTLLRSI